MRLTSFSDFAFRVLLFAAARPDRLITIDEIAEVFDVSRAHLTKVVNTLTQSGYLKAYRGRSGGLALGKTPEKINLGDVLRVTEPDFALVECMREDNQCVLTRACKLRGPMEHALAAFHAELGRHTLSDIMLREADFPA
ncbi:MAG: RrF2 family transcriptional regulator [Geminicoccales bacterium]